MEEQHGRFDPNKRRVNQPRPLRRTPTQDGSRVKPEPHLAAVVEHLNQARVACAGDIMLDHFVYGDVSRISPEAPVPVLGIKRQESMLGGAGNVVRNLHALGCGIGFFGILGDDAPAAEIERSLAALSGCQWSLERENGRRTTVKTRYIAAGQQLMRADVETSGIAGEAVLGKVLSAFTAALPDCNAVLLSDYAKGLLSGTNAQHFIRAARAAGKPVVVDPKGRDFQRYRGATVIKPNLKELGEAVGASVSEPAMQEAAARQLLQELDVEFLLVTCGSAGMMLASRDGPVTRFPALAREVFDVSGAGDTVAEVLAAGLGSGASITAAVEAANLAAGIVVSKLGTAVVSRSEMVHELQHRSVVSAGDKILRHDELAEQVRTWRERGLRIGFTNGCFDLLHPGHLSLLETARKHCDRLVVAVNSDESVRRLKGPGRPVQDETARALVLASLRCVDAVVVFEADTPLELIALLRPALLVKGRDYRPEEVVGADLLPAWNGELLLVDIVPDQSTAQTVSRLSNPQR